MQRNFQRLETMLRDSDSSCNIELMGVAHVGRAGQGIIDAAKSAQILTLELPRNIVHIGLAGEQTRILEKNAFWRSLINGIRDQAGTQMVRGIEVNQTMRIAYKRLMPHYGSGGLSPSMYILEVEDTHNKTLDFLKKHRLLSKDDLLALQQYNWAIVDNKRLFYTVYNAMRDVLKHGNNEHLNKHSFDMRWHRHFSTELRLAAISNEIPKNGRYLTTLIKEVDSSLVRSNALIVKSLARMNLGLTVSERYTIGLCALQTVLLSHAELKDAEEIFTCTYQYAKQHGGENIRLLHIGGAAHTALIRDMLMSSISEGSRINVSMMNDPRFEASSVDVITVSIPAFFRRHIPFNELLSSVWADHYEVYADPKNIVSMVRKAITENLAEFYKILFIDRMVGGKDDTLSDCKKINKKKSDLDALPINVLYAKYMRSVPELGDKE